MRDWRWHFLRRRSDDQADFAALSPAGARRSADATTRAAPGDLSIGPLRAWLQKKAPAELVEKYGVRYLLDPACPCPLGQRSEGAKCNVIADLEQQRNAEAEDHYSVTFDLRSSIKDQIAAVRPLLTAEARRRGFGVGRHSREHWPRHLRVLDGIATGASFTDLADAFDLDYAAAAGWKKLALNVQRQLTSGGQ
jgi:hypothetical protein